MAPPKRTATKRTMPRKKSRGRVAAVDIVPEADPEPGRGPLLRRPRGAGARRTARARHARIAAGFAARDPASVAGGSQHKGHGGGGYASNTTAAIEFATPVLRDSASDMRQVLTDEIVLRLEAWASQSNTGSGQGRARARGSEAQRVRTNAVHRQGAARERHPDARRRALARSARRCRVRQSELPLHSQTVDARRPT